MRRTIVFPALAFLFACEDPGAFAPATTDGSPEPALSAAPGQEKSFDIVVEFPLSVGSTVADENGLTYFYMGREINYPDLLYPAEYWGEYALHLPGQAAYIVVRVTNLGPRQNARLRAVTEAYVMNLDGSNGQMIKPPETVDEVRNWNNELVPFDLAAGETGAFLSAFILPQVGKVLDRFVVKLYHRNEGGGPGNEDPGWIMTEEAIFCPFDPDADG